MTDLKAIRQKILEFTPAEILTYNGAAQKTSKMDENVRLPFRRKSNLTPGERSAHDRAHPSL